MISSSPTRARPMEAGGDQRTFVFYALISLAFHLVFFLALVLLPQLRPPKPFMPSVINVRMVSLPAPGPAAPAAPAPAPETVKPPEPPAKEKVPVTPPPKPPKPEVEQAPEPPEVVSIAPPETPKAKKSYKPKTSLKKKTYQADKVAKKPVKKSKPKPKKPAGRSKAVNDAIKRLQNQVAKDGRALGSGAGGPGGGMGAQALRLIDIYQAEVVYLINRNWAWAEQLAGTNEKLEAVIVIKIAASGDITSIRFEKRSGNRHLDDSVTRAVEKSNPLPPLPPGYPRSYYELGLRFGPSGLM